MMSLANSSSLSEKSSARTQQNLLHGGQNIQACNTHQSKTTDVYILDIFGLNRIQKYKPIKPFDSYLIRVSERKIGCNVLYFLNVMGKICI